MNHYINSNNNYAIKERLVNEGKSRIFNDWNDHVPLLTKEDFLAALKWVCEDQLDENGKLTREIGLTRNGIVKLKRTYNAAGMCTMYHILDNGEVWGLWNGDSFEMPCPKYIDPSGKCMMTYKISLSAKDRI
jgi:hypothetical protein